jgi:hypothetical protein
LSAEAQAAGAADARRYGPRQLPCEPLLDLHDLLPATRGDQRAYAAGDVEPHAARRDDAALLRIERRDAAYRESVAPVRIGHGVGRTDDARKASDVCDLLANLVVHLRE